MDPTLLPSIFRGAAVSDLPSLEALATIAVPTLILAWAEDSGHPVATADALHQAIAGSRLEVATSFEAASSWASVVTDFLA